MSSISAFIKGMDLAEIDGLIDSIEFGGPAALPFALSVYNLDRVLDALKKRKAELTQSFGDGSGSITRFLSPVGGGVVPRTVGQRGGAVEVEPTQAEEETKEPDPRVRETIIDIEPPSSIGRPGLRQRTPAVGPEEPPLQDVDLEDPQPRPEPEPEEPRLPRIIRRGGEIAKEEIRRRLKSRGARIGAGLAGSAGVTIWGIVKGMYPNATIKMRPDGNIEVEEPDGTKKIIDPKDVPIPPESETQGQAPAGGGFGTSQFNLKGKYKNPRRGRHNYILFEAYSDKASKSTGAGAPNVKKPSLEI